MKSTYASVSLWIGRENVICIPKNDYSAIRKNQVSQEDGSVCKNTCWASWPLEFYIQIPQWENSNSWNLFSKFYMKIGMYKCMQSFIYNSIYTQSNNKQKKFIKQQRLQLYVTCKIMNRTRSIMLTRIRQTQKNWYLRYSVVCCSDKRKYTSKVEWRNI